MVLGDEPADAAQEIHIGQSAFAASASALRATADKSQLRRDSLRQACL